MFRELNWDQNKKNWQEILGEERMSTEKVIDMCDIWQPRLPMQMTPGSDSIKPLFPSDRECMETIGKVETQTPGFAIASKSWMSLLPQLAIRRPPMHLCDILTIAKGEGLEKPTKPNIVFWVIVSSSTEQTVQRQIEYMFIVGRAIKHQLSRQDRTVPAPAIRCMLHSIHEEDNVRIANAMREVGIQNMQDFLWSVFSDTDSFDGIQRCIALLLQSQTSPISICASNQLSVALSAHYAKLLLEIKSNVCYVSFGPGSGKTLYGLALYRDFGKERSVYISPTEPLLHYLRYNGCDATLVRNDEDLHRRMQSGTFENKMCVIIDGSHQLRCSKTSLRDLFILMKTRQMRLFVLADNVHDVYQSFERENQLQFAQYIFELSLDVWNKAPTFQSFIDIFRSTRKIVSFLHHAMGDPDSDGKYERYITRGYAFGDGVQCIAMQNLTDNRSDNALIQYLCPLLDSRYQVTEVAVLLDSGYTDDDINNIRYILQTHLPRVSTHSSSVFPREGIIVDRVDSFSGLDAALCIFLLSPEAGTDQEATLANPRYRVYLASRATHKAVFVVPKITAEVVQHLKFDYFPGEIYIN